MYQRHKDGADAEKFARRFLKKRGLKFLQGNYRSRYGEIDLIMEDGDTLVFVEVRYRHNREIVAALESIQTVQALLQRPSADLADGKSDHHLLDGPLASKSTHIWTICLTNRKNDRIIPIT